MYMCVCVRTYVYVCMVCMYIYVCMVRTYIYVCMVRMYIYVYMVRTYIYVCMVRMYIRESVDSLCRDGSDTPIVRVHWKTFLTREYSRFKPFSAREWPIQPILYPTIPHK